MKPSFLTSARQVGADYDQSTDTWVPYVSSATYTSRQQVVSGSNNKNLRPCSSYYFHHTLNEWVRFSRTYGVINDQLVVTSYRDGPSIPLLSSVKTIQYGSLSEARSKIFGQSLNLAMTAKDIIDANKMASSYFGKVAKAAPYLRKKQFGKALKAFFGTKSKSLAAANSWLEFQFGVLPTIHAVQDVYNHAAAGIRANRGRLLRLRSASRKLQVQDESLYWEVVPDHSIVSQYVCYRYLSKQDFLQNMSRFNLVEVGWDATPWSFLIDWFVPVGDYLSQFGSITTFTTDGCDSVKIQEEERGTMRERENPGLTGYSEYSVNRHVVDFRRTVNATLSLNMTLSEMIQRSKLNISCRRTATAFALARQRVGRK